VEPDRLPQARDSCLRGQRHESASVGSADHQAEFRRPRPRCRCPVRAVADRSPARRRVWVLPVRSHGWARRPRRPGTRCPRHIGSPRTVGRSSRSLMDLFTMATAAAGDREGSCGLLQPRTHCPGSAVQATAPLRGHVELPPRSPSSRVMPCSLSSPLPPATLKPRIMSPPTLASRRCGPGPTSSKQPPTQGPGKGNSCQRLGRRSPRRRTSALHASGSRSRRRLGRRPSRLGATTVGRHRRSSVARAS